MKRLSIVALAFGIGMTSPGQAKDAFRAAEGPRPSTANELRARVRKGVDPSGRTGYLTKRFVGGPFQVIPEAILESDLTGSGELPPDAPRAFVVLGPEGYTWRFSYDRAAGIPAYRHRGGAVPGTDVLEVDAPAAMAFVPSADIYWGHGLVCTNVRTCMVPGCWCCIVCYCATPGTMCDSDDTGFYSRFERLEEEHEVVLR